MHGQRRRRQQFNRLRIHHSVAVESFRGAAVKQRQHRAGRMQQLVQPVHQPRHQFRIEIVEQDQRQHTVKSFLRILQGSFQKFLRQNGLGNFIRLFAHGSHPHPLFFSGQKFLPRTQEVLGRNPVALLDEKCQRRLRHLPQIQDAPVPHIADQPHKFLQPVRYAHVCSWRCRRRGTRPRCRPRRGCRRSAEPGFCHPVHIAFYSFAAATGVVGEISADFACPAATPRFNSPARVVSTFPRNRAPSSIATRGVIRLPCTWLVAPSRTLSPAFKFPCTVPSITISRSSMSACTCPCGPTVTFDCPNRTLPCASPSMYKSPVPLISPCMRSPTEIVELPPGAGVLIADTEAGGATVTLGGVTFGVIGSGAVACGACTDSLPSAGLDHIEFLPQDIAVTPGQGAGVLVTVAELYYSRTRV